MYGRAGFQKRKMYRKAYIIHLLYPNLAEKDYFCVQLCISDRIKL